MAEGSTVLVLGNLPRLFDMGFIRRLIRIFGRSNTIHQASDGSRECIPIVAVTFSSQARPSFHMRHIDAYLESLRFERISARWEGAAKQDHGDTHAANYRLSPYIVKKMRHLQAEYRAHVREQEYADRLIESCIAERSERRTGQQS
ncbi:hypothetical protein PAPHI01_0751 [Pancytospora philotis]|nr:hypothetical protein PAPHI01_0751 [Pancytospora philotis]